MALKETKSNPKDLIEAVPEEISQLESDPEVLKEISVLESAAERRAREASASLDAWVPKTELGKKVKSGKLKDIDKVLAEEKKILEPEIADLLMKLDSDLLLIGHSRGKFGGGKRRAWRQTQRKTMEGNVLTFSCMAVVGDKKGHIGLGYGRSKETLPSREKAIRDAKINIKKITLGFEDPNDASSSPHTIPFKVEGKCSSVRVTFWPAPRGTGLVAGDEIKKILRLVGIKDIYSKSFGKTRTTFNTAKACMDALTKTNKILR